MKLRKFWAMGGEGHQHTILPNFPNKCMKLRNLDQHKIFAKISKNCTKLRKFLAVGRGAHLHTILPKFKKKTLHKIEKILGRGGDPETSPLNPPMGRES